MMNIAFLINFLITLLLLGLIFYLIVWVIGWIGVGEPLNKILKIVIGAIFILVLLGMAFGPVPHLSVWRG
jgi:uncharacterized membrane protein